MEGVCPDGINLPCQHSLQHYHRLIQQFGAPDGLSTSITESKHIDAVKKPWCHSSHFEELKQILLINQRLDKLAAFHSHLFGEGLLDVPLVPEGTQKISNDSDSDSDSDDLEGIQMIDDDDDDDEQVDSVISLPKNPGVYGSLLNQ